MENPCTELNRLWICDEVTVAITVKKNMIKSSGTELFHIPFIKETSHLRTMAFEDKIPKEVMGRIIERFL